ncbi:MAG: histidinol-phosphate transaminase [Clostridiales bacterium]|jgi:histidinol-phosphate aminotransferase|nr:histidinol-phosphate transaminase [Clostridiales bacterium]MDR2752393.1 histidinol-phosphate transaminase [Clostridiales bacterium]
MSAIEHRKSIDPMSPYVPGKPIDDVKRELGLKEVIKLASNENPLGTSPKAKEAAIASFEATNLYPDGNCTALRNSLSKRLGVKPERLLFGCGADEIISFIGKVFVNPGDECVTAKITFSQYEASVNAMGGTMVYVPMKNHGFDLDGILEKITPKTKAIFLANPNNPTGTAFTGAEQARFLEKVPEGVLVAIDEAYGEYADMEDYPNTLPMLEKYKNVIWIKTFSKIYGLASLRVGYAVAAEPLISLFEKIRPPFNVTVQGQAAARAALHDQEFVKKSFESNKASKAYCQKAFAEMGLEWMPTEANFITVNVGIDTRIAFAALMKKGYIVRPGHALGMEGWLRVTLGTIHQMEGFVKALGEVLEENAIASENI